MNPYIQMHGGLTVDLLNPDPNDYVLASLAFALGYLNRYCGHLGVYSVAEHLVLGTRALRDMGADPSIQRGYLLHDAHEAVTGDVSQPVKKALLKLGFDFGTFERLHERAVELRFRVNTRQGLIKHMDMAMCIAEATQGFGMLMTRSDSNGWPNVAAAPVQIQRWPAERATTEFLYECDWLDIR